MLLCSNAFVSGAHHLVTLDISNNPLRQVCVFIRNSAASHENASHLT
jgi:hypothetical protein